MKSFLAISNVILIIAVVVLFCLYFNYAKEDNHRMKDANAMASNSFRIAYFDLDTLQSKYEAYKKVRNDLRIKDSDMTSELNEMRTSYINKVKEYQGKGNSMSPAEQNNAQQELSKMQEDYQQRQQEMSQEMNSISMQRLQEIKVKIQDFLKDYCREKGYTYVFASSGDDYLYYKDTLRNITDDIVKQLNTHDVSATEK